jgi:hypothetical protein
MFVNSRFSTSHRDRSVDRYLPVSTAAGAGWVQPAYGLPQLGGHRVLPLEPPPPTELQRISRPCLDLPRVIRARHAVRPLNVCLPRHPASIAPAANSRQWRLSSTVARQRSVTVRCGPETHRSPITYGWVSVSSMLVVRC